MANFAQLGIVYKSNSEYNELSLKAESDASFTAYDGEKIEIKKGDFYIIRTVSEEKDSQEYLLKQGIIKQDVYDKKIDFLDKYGDNIRAIISVRKKK